MEEDDLCSLILWLSGSTRCVFRHISSEISRVQTPTNRHFLRLLKRAANMPENTSGPVIGALPPPPGVTPNFVDPPSIQGGIVAVVVVSLTVSTLCIVSRTAIGSANRFANSGWDDCECSLCTEDHFVLGPFWLFVAYVLRRYVFLCLGVWECYCLV